jgi:signal transduction histidine kinase
MRPPSLDDLGLQGALEGIAEREGTHGARQITPHCDTAAHDLPPQVETCAYRAAEQAIRALHGSLTVKLNVDHDHTLRIEPAGHSDDQGEQLLAKLAAAQARLELMGGTLQAISNGHGAATIAVELPLHPTPHQSSRPTDTVNSRRVGRSEKGIRWGARVDLSFVLARGLACIPCAWKTVCGARKGRDGRR